MWFFPMLDVPSVPKAGSTAALLQDRFVAYQQHMRANFFDTHFASFDRQIMLVDVLGALYTGRTAFDDTARVIHDLSAALRYGVYNAPRAVIAGIVRGSSHMLPSILGRATQGAAQKMAQHRIQRVVFVATKADHVPAMKRDNLLGLVRNLAEAGRPRHENAGVGVTHRVAASILSTRDGLSRAEGRAVEVVEGVVLGEDRARPFFIGDVPSAKPPDSFWTERMFHLPVFKPPRIDPDGMLGIPHLNLDQVLDDVIGDLL
jgi:predicted YcjX-like family ATPase